MTENETRKQIGEILWEIWRGNKTYSSLSDAISEYASILKDTPCKSKTKAHCVDIPEDYAIHVH